MSEDAQEHITRFGEMYEDLCSRRERVADMQLELMVKTTQMHAVGLLAVETDPDRIADGLNLVDKTSLR